MLGFYSYNGLSIMGIYIYIYSGFHSHGGTPNSWATTILGNLHMGI